MARGADSIRAIVNVHLVTAQKTDQSLVIRPRKFDGQTRRRGNGRDDRNPGSERFLHHLERNAPAQQQNLAVEREAIREQRPADQFVERVVPADVLARTEERSIFLK